MLKQAWKWIRILGISIAVIFSFLLVNRYLKENAILKKMIERLEADTRVAQVLVTEVKYDEQIKKNLTTIKFLEYDAKGKPLEPKYFRFAGNIIQFQALVIRFDDMKVRLGDRLKGKSAYIFLSAFMLDGSKTQVFEITKVYDVPEGYRVDNAQTDFERKLWKRFWEFALNPQLASHPGVKNAQIEAPGTMFLPGTLYTIKIEHDGGLRIDAEVLPQILRGEVIH